MELIGSDSEMSTIDPYPWPKIQKVQPHLQKHAKYYSPKLVSIGPIHSHKNLEQGQKYKSMWAARYLQEKCFGKIGIAQILLREIENELPALKTLYTKDAIQDHSDEDLAWIFFLDGCAVLHFMEKVVSGSLQELKIKVDQIVAVQHDLLLLENQLPFQVLWLLRDTMQAQKPVSGFCLHDLVIEFLKILDIGRDELRISFNLHDIINCGQGKIIIRQSVHLLHFLHSLVIGKKAHDKQGLLEWYAGKKSYDKKVLVKRNAISCWEKIIQKLKASRIGIKKHKNNDLRFTDIYFREDIFRGVLYLPELVVDNFMASILVNLIAFELCPDFDNNYKISSYMAFLDSFIDHANDVKELRKAGILYNALGNDEELVTFFKTVSHDVVSNDQVYKEVRDQIEAHCKTKYNIWMAQAYVTYFNFPTIILAALVAFVTLFFRLFKPGSPHSIPRKLPE